MQDLRQKERAPMAVTLEKKAKKKGKQAETAKARRHRQDDVMEPPVEAIDEAAEDHDEPDAVLPELQDDLLAGGGDEELPPTEWDHLSGEQVFLTPEEERETIRRVQEGDTNAFEALVNAYQRKAYYVAAGFVNNHEDALDLSQDAFVKAFKAIKSFDLNSPFFPWFYKIIKNHCLNYIKKSGRVRSDSIEGLEEEKYMQFREEKPDPRAQYEIDEVRQKLWEAIERLKPDFREIIIMKHYHNLAYKEIADVLNIPIGTVMSRLFNARRELREKYLEILGEKQ